MGNLRIIESRSRLPITEVDRKKHFFNLVSPVYFYVFESSSPIELDKFVQQLEQREYDHFSDDVALAVAYVQAIKIFLDSEVTDETKLVKSSLRIKRADTFVLQDFITKMQSVTETDSMLAELITLVSHAVELVGTDKNNQQLSVDTRLLLREALSLQLALENLYPRLTNRAKPEFLDKIENVILASIASHAKFSGEYRMVDLAVFSFVHAKAFYRLTNIDLPVFLFKNWQNSRMNVLQNGEGEK